MIIIITIIIFIMTIMTNIIIIVMIITIILATEADWVATLLLRFEMSVEPANTRKKLERARVFKGPVEICFCNVFFAGPQPTRLIKPNRGWAAEPGKGCDVRR